MLPVTQCHAACDTVSCCVWHCVMLPVTLCHAACDTVSCCLWHCVMLPAETAVMRNRLLTLSKPSQTAESILQTCRVFPYWDTRYITLHYITSSLCKNVLNITVHKFYHLFAILRNEYHFARMHTEICRSLPHGIKVWTGLFSSNSTRPTILEVWSGLFSSNSTRPTILEVWSGLFSSNSTRPTIRRCYNLGHWKCHCIKQT